MMTHEYTLPPGRYLLSDPCYVIKNELWGKFLDKVLTPVGLFASEKVISNKLFHPEFEGCIFDTYFGDGSFTIKVTSEENIFSSITPYNKKLNVDSGMIGLIQVPNDWLNDSYSYAQGLMAFIFINKIKCFSHNGVIHFGDIVIDTKCDSEYDDDEEDNDPDYSDDNKVLK